MTLMVLRGMSPTGILFWARCRHSLGGIDCRNCSMAGKSSTASRVPLASSCGRLRAIFQTHFRTSSASFASFDPIVVPLGGKGFVICSNKANSALLYQVDLISPNERSCRAYRKIDIRLPVANIRRTIILMKRERSLTLGSSLSSVCSSRVVNSSSKDVRISTVKDSASTVWSQKELRVCIRCFASRKLPASATSLPRSKTCDIWRVTVSIKPSV